jgi:hypothetical protein
LHAKTAPYAIYVRRGFDFDVFDLIYGMIGTFFFASAMMSMNFLT